MEKYIDPDTHIDPKDAELIYDYIVGYHGYFCKIHNDILQQLNDLTKQPYDSIGEFKEQLRQFIHKIPSYLLGNRFIYDEKVKEKNIDNLILSVIKQANAALDSLEETPSTTGGSVNHILKRAQYILNDATEKGYYIPYKKELMDQLSTRQIHNMTDVSELMKPFNPVDVVKETLDYVKKCLSLSKPKIQQGGNQYKFIFSKDMDQETIDLIKSTYPKIQSTTES